MSNKKCPLCHQKITGYPALSRKDNKTQICSNCGMMEAINIAKENMKTTKLMRVIMTRKSENKKQIINSIKAVTAVFGTAPKTIEIKKIIELEKEKYEYFSNNLLKENDIIKENKKYCAENEDAILIKEIGVEDKEGIVVMCEGFDYARYTGIVVE